MSDDTLPMRPPVDLTEVDIAGRRYRFRRPKRRSMLMAFAEFDPQDQDPRAQAAMYRAVEDMLVKYAEKGEAILARLDDENDPIDIDDVMSAFTTLMQDFSGADPTQAASSSPPAVADGRTGPAGALPQDTIPYG